MLSELKKKKSLFISLFVILFIYLSFIILYTIHVKCSVLSNTAGWKTQDYYTNDNMDDDNRAYF